jgi:hypothetical protein
MRRLAEVSVGRSPRRLKVACQGGGQHVNEKAGLPSSMFLISTERSATSLSTTNCSLSDVTRRTIVKVDGRCRCKELRGGLLGAAFWPLSNPLTGHFATTLPLIMSFLSFLRFSDSAYSPFSVLGYSPPFLYFIISHP